MESGNFGMKTISEDIHEESYPHPKWQVAEAECLYADFMGQNWKFHKFVGGLKENHKFIKVNTQLCLLWFLNVKSLSPKNKKKKKHVQNYLPIGHWMISVGLHA